MAFYCPANSRDAGQRAEMDRLDRAGVCLFCPEHLARERVLSRTTWWSVTENAYPYAGTRLHLLLIPTVHAAELLHLPEPARADLWTALEWVRGRHALDFYGLGLRSGNCAYTGGTIEHLHLHVIVGDVADPGHEPVLLKLSSRPDRPAEETEAPA
ncbi:MAG: HIT domain-containing protein [Nonomuraea sp.]|nr:HIT domain-containing protein [Nonomuraea sp.]NUS04514.1 HIT domain-containing protein [Nonomuraea sp.]